MCAADAFEKYLKGNECAMVMVAFEAIVHRTIYEDLYDEKENWKVLECTYLFLEKYDPFQFPIRPCSAKIKDLHAMLDDYMKVQLSVIDVTSESLSISHIISKYLV